MRLTIVTLCALLLLSLSGCGANAPVAAPPTTAESASTGDATLAPSPLPTSSAAYPATTTTITATPFEETNMPTEPPLTPEDRERQDQPTTPPAPTRPTFQATAISPPSTVTPAPAAAPKPSGPVPDALVNAAKADLAQRQAVALDTISTVEVRSVVWPDGGLGCPRPDMAYTQVQVEGLLIRLSSAGQVFEYHSGGGKAPFLCEQKPQGASPAPPPGGGENQ